MNLSFTRTLISISIISVLTYDFQVRFLYDGLIYLNDLLFPLALIFYIKAKFMKRWEIVAFLVIPFYLIIIFLFNLLGPFDSFLRDSQYFIRSLYPLLLLAIILKHDKRLDSNYLKDYSIKFFRNCAFILSIIGLIAFFLLIVGIDILPYTSGRTWFNSRQLSSIFSEPALYGQMIVTYFFISYNSLKDIKKDAYRVLIVGVSLLFCQSAGAIFSVFIFVIYLAFKKQNVIKILRSAVVIISLILISLYSITNYLPSARITSILQNKEARGVALDRSGEIRVLNEIKSLEEFLKDDVQTGLFGLKNTGSSEFRVNRVDPLMGDIVGNGLVEITLRYGLFYIFFTVMLFYKVLNRGNYFKFFIFFMLIVQIDGAIGKPWIWFYITMFILSTKNENIFNNQP